MPKDINELRKEFFEHVWDHANDPFQQKFDEPEDIPEGHVDGLRQIHLTIVSETGGEAIDASVNDQVVALGLPFLQTLLQITGLTRNKILSDLRAASIEAKAPSKWVTLPRSACWPYALKYLRRPLLRVLKPLDGVDVNIVSSLNAATYPGFIRQERAKRQGHEAEARLAAVFHSLGIPFVPEAKVINPLCRDIQIHGVSFDLVVPSKSAPGLVVKSTVHTSNIGQYGESKDSLEITEAVSMLEQQYSPATRPLLLAAIDGIGFRSNAAGLNGVLEGADEFCQFRTLWKAAVIGAHVVQRRIALEESVPGAFDGMDAFLSRYAATWVKGNGKVHCGDMRATLI